MTNQDKLFKNIPGFMFFLSTLIYFFVKSLPWPFDIHGAKLSFYRDIFLWQYCV